MITQHAYAGKTFVCNDPRADGHSRRVRVEADHVAIARRFQGIEMRLAVPVATFRGVALCVHADAFGAPIFEVMLVHTDAELNLVLEQSSNEADLTAKWRHWSAFFALTKLVERQAGVYHTAESDPDWLRDGPRRRGHLTSQRRGRFAARRKTGQATRMQQRFAGEREMIARN